MRWEINTPAMVNSANLRESRGTMEINLWACVGGSFYVRQIVVGRLTLKVGDTVLRPGVLN